jgi:uncharacterized protein YutE (UPF0331/DUF86 family)
MVDRKALDRMMENLKIYVAQLNRLSEFKEDEFLSDMDKLGSAKYYLIVAIESCIDIANHIISTEGFRRPSDFADTFVVLFENGLIDKELKEPLQNMARFRNLLVHLYGKVDDKRVYSFLQVNLPDFNSFVQQILAII